MRNLIEKFTVDWKIGEQNSKKKWFWKRYPLWEKISITICIYELIYSKHQHGSRIVQKSLYYIKEREHKTEQTSIRIYQLMLSIGQKSSSFDP